MTSIKFLFLHFFFCVLLFTGCSDNNQSLFLYTINGFTMGTSYSVKFTSASRDFKQESLKKEIESLLKEINQEMSTYIEDSDLSLINKNHSNEWINISDSLYTVISTAISISILTGGAFDITVGPLVNLWGFGPETTPDQLPPENVIISMLQNTGYRLIQLRENPHAIKKINPDLYIDLSGIAKGYAVDEIASLLEKASLTDYMVEIGGEIKARGKSNQQRPWRIGIEKPIYDQRTVHEILELKNTAMATSGDYRNYREIEGKRYSHTIDPATGKPVKHHLASVTVLHESAMMADALATAILVMGTEKGLDFAAKLDYAVLLISRDINQQEFNSHMSKKFKKFIVNKN